MNTQKNQKWIALFATVALLWLSAAFVSHHVDTHHMSHEEPSHSCELFSICKTSLHSHIPILDIPNQFIILFAFITYCFLSSPAPNRVARSPPQYRLN